jgi:hypothetical protein
MNNIRPAVTLLYFDGCPHVDEAHERLVQALHRVGLAGVVIARQLVESPDE